MSGMIIYKSKYGATKKYAEWLSEETGFPCVSTKDADINKAADCDVVILGGGIYAGGIACVSYLKKNIGKLKGKKIILYTCGASPYDEEFFQALTAQNMKGELSEIPVFYCRGSFGMNDISFTDRTLCKLLQKAISKKDPKDYDVLEKTIISVKDGESCDWTDKSYLAPVLEAVRT